MKTPAAISPSTGCRILTFILALAVAFVAIRPAVAQTQADAQKPFDLAAFLKTAAEYCQRLESFALNYTCREEIDEKFDLTRDIEKPSDPMSTWSDGPGNRYGLGATILSRSTARYRHSLVYDYQCVRDFKGSIRDTRTLLEENGKKKNVPAAKLATANFDYGRTLLAPVGIFAERFQNDFDFAVVGREMVGRKAVAIVDAKPKPDALVSQNLFGRAWVDPATNEILKIEWDESRIGRYEVFRERGEKYKMTPRITVTSEFSVEKNGLRFPTKAFYEEAYLNERGRKWVRSETTVEYTDFKFFTVEVEIK
jgi:hypothetical protein